jgi:hypothetical protein
MPIRTAARREGGHMGAQPRDVGDGRWRWMQAALDGWLQAAMATGALRLLDRNRRREMFWLAIRVCPLGLVLALIMGGIWTLRYQFNGCDLLDLPPSLPFYIGIDRYRWAMFTPIRPFTMGFLSAVSEVLCLYGTILNKERERCCSLATTLARVHRQKLFLVQPYACMRPKSLIKRQLLRNNVFEKLYLKF